MVDLDGYILQVILPIVLKVSPETARHAISDPVGKLVPIEASKVLAKVISMAEVMELSAEF